MSAALHWFLTLHSSVAPMQVPIANVPISKAESDRPRQSPFRASEDDCDSRGRCKVKSIESSSTRFICAAVLAFPIIPPFSARIRGIIIQA